LGVVTIKKYAKIISFGVILWLVPFLTGFPFVDASGEFLIRETFFKSVMIVVSSLAGVFLAVIYFQKVKTGYVKEGITIGLAWLLISLVLDLLLVRSGFFAMSYTHYFQDIGLRYLSIPIYTLGMGYATREKLSKS